MADCPVPDASQRRQVQRRLFEQCPDEDRHAHDPLSVVEEFVQGPQDGGLVTGNEQEAGVAGCDRDRRSLAVVFLFDRLERRQEAPV